MTEQSVPAVDPAEDLPEQMRVRRSKRDRLLAEGKPPYPVNLPRTATLAEIRTRYADLPTDTALDTPEWLGVFSHRLGIDNGASTRPWVRYR